MARKLDKGETLVVASHNKGKVVEIGDLVRPFGIETISAGDLDLPEPEETEDSFIGNALLKARAAAAPVDMLRERRERCPNAERVAMRGI